MGTYRGMNGFIPPFQIDYGGDLWYPISKEETAMKVLSTRLAMRDGYLPEQFRHTIVEWLKAGPPSKDASFNKGVTEKTQISARRHG